MRPLLHEQPKHLAIPFVPMVSNLLPSLAKFRAFSWTYSTWKQFSNECQINRLIFYFTKDGWHRYQSDHGVFHVMKVIQKRFLRDKCRHFLAPEEQNAARVLPPLLFGYNHGFYCVSRVCLIPLNNGLTVEWPCAFSIYM